MSTVTSTFTSQGEDRKLEANPMRRETQSREPEAFSNAPRCHARTREGRLCRSAAMNGKRICRMHGGRSSGAPKGAANGAWKHGGWANEALALRAAARRLLAATRSGG